MVRGCPDGNCPETRLQQASGVLATRLRKAEELLDKLTITRQPDSAGSNARRSRTQLVRARILDHLANHGASRLSDICNAVNSSRGSVQYVIGTLEADSIVQADIPAGQRANYTPYYSLTRGSKAANVRRPDFW